MTIDEAIELMRNEKACALKADICNRDCSKCELVRKTEDLLSAYDMAIKALEQTRWIPVSKKLPEICEENCDGNITLSKFVLTCQIYGNGFIWIGTDKCTTDGGWLSEVPFDNPDECCKVIAWMPLPEPYNELGI